LPEAVHAVECEAHVILIWHCLRGGFFAALVRQALLGARHVAGAAWTVDLLGLAVGGQALLRVRVGRS
jgi:hypothetical protein